MPSGPSVSDDAPVTSLELFFDLVFVFTLTQLTSLLVDHLTWATAGRVLITFLLLFWMYAGYAYLTNQVPPDRIPRRIPLIIGMWAFLVCALAIPTAFGAGGLYFGIGYAVVTAVHSALYWQGFRRGVLWFAAPNVLAAALVLVGSIVGGWIADVLWTVAIAVHLVVTPTLARFAPRLDDSGAGTGLRVGHFVERHGLLLIVAFGESVIAVGIGLAGKPLDVGTLAVALLGLVLATTLWWTYFMGDDERSERALHAVPRSRRVTLGLRSYFFAYVPMLLGVVVLAAGVKKSVGHFGEHLASAPALALGGGVALYLVGTAAFRLALGLPGVLERIVAALLTIATTPLGIWVASGMQLGALVVVLVATLVFEGRRATAL